jgi:hypothetical protein
MKENGGPAFPHDAGSKEFERTGMSLRDYFAGQALLQLNSDKGCDALWVAASAYAVADAMLAQRSKP